MGVSGFKIGDRVRVKPEHDELLHILGRPTKPGTVTEVYDDDDCVIVAEDGSTSAPYRPDELERIEDPGQACCGGSCSCGDGA